MRERVIAKMDGCLADEHGDVLRPRDMLDFELAQYVIENIESDEWGKRNLLSACEARLPALERHVKCVLDGKHQ